MSTEKPGLRLDFTDDKGRGFTLIAIGLNESSVVVTDAAVVLSADQEDVLRAVLNARAAKRDQDA